MIVDPRELTLNGGRLRSGPGRPIDLVYRRLIIQDILARPEETRALVAAARANAVVHCQPVRLRRAGSQVGVRPADHAGA